MLLDQIDTLSAQIEKLTERAEQLLAAMPDAQAPEHPGSQPPGISGSSPAPGVISTAGAAEDTPAGRGLTAWQRLDEVTGIGPLSAQVIIAEVGLDMGRFATAGHLVSWAKLSPRTIQSGSKARGGATGKGNPYLKGVLGEAAAGGRVGALELLRLAHVVEIAWVDGHLTGMLPLFDGGDQGQLELAPLVLPAVRHQQGRGVREAIHDDLHCGRHSQYLLPSSPRHRMARNQRQAYPTCSILGRTCHAQVQTVVRWRSPPASYSRLTLPGSAPIWVSSARPSGRMSRAQCARVADQRGQPGGHLSRNPAGRRRHEGLLRLPQRRSR